MLRITPEVHRHMVAHGLWGLPDEACGMVSTDGRSDLVDLFHPMRNAAESASLFELDGQEMIDVERQVESAGRTLVGVMHSHVATSAYPSPTDVADISRFDPFGAFIHVIVSLRHAEPVLRAYRISEGVIVEEPVEVAVADPTPATDGTAREAVAAVIELPAAE